MIAVKNTGLALVLLLILPLFAVFTRHVQKRMLAAQLDNRRAVADPAVLLLDEITANLDAETEARVLEALRRASEGRTVLSISHRIYENLGGRTVEIKDRNQ